MIRFQALEWGTDDSGLFQTIATIHFSKIPFILCSVSCVLGFPNAHVTCSSIIHRLLVQEELCWNQCSHSRKLVFSLRGQQPRPPLPSSALSDQVATSSHLQLPLPWHQGLGVGKTAILLLVGWPYLGI